ncbi:MAG TPA: glycosyltransferase family 39 protein, partial [Phototrophicaceae bacterium]|nr:glycosyltransferase family 39 protein [Phototrophicaceae bacterium]
MNLSLYRLYLRSKHINQCLSLSLLTLILLIGAGLRFHAVTEDVRFHPDEALFATFARNAAVYGDWMLPGALDKTPLSLYASALGMQLVGVSVNERGVLDQGLKQGEFAARLPHTLAGIVLIALVYQLAKTVSQDDWSALYAAVLVAFSPWLIAFSATAFTDTLMLFGMIASLLMAVRGRPGWSGGWLAVSIWSKQQGVFYLPLMLWFVLQPAFMASWSKASPAVHRFLKFIVAFAVGIGLLLLWDVARGTTSIFALAAVNNNPERTFVRLDEVLPRLMTWLSYASSWFGMWWLTGGVILAGIVGLWRQKQGVIMVVYSLAYLVAHIGLAFNTYDRYLLPLIPLMAVVGGMGIVAGVRFIIKSGTERKIHVLALMVLSTLMLLTGLPARFPTDTDTRERDNDIVELTAYLNAKPLGAIIYDHWLGWETGYYLGAWSDKRKVYYPDPMIQAEDALLNPDPAPR